MHRSAQVASAAGSRPLDGRTRRPDVPCSSRPCAGPRAARRVAVVCSSVAPIDPWEAKVQTPWTEPDPARLTSDGFYDAGPAAPSALAPTPAPDYSTIDAKPWNAAIMGLFIRKLEAALGERTAKQGYEAVIELTKRLNAKYGDPRETHEATVGILLSLFPSWLPVAFAALFSRPMPGLSARLNALATQLTCEWLMGPLAVNDVVVDSGEVGKGHGLLVQRCRYLEQGGCASVCINSCKVPTQLFFSRHMGLPLTMTPNYDDYSCQFAFGKTPPALSQDPISTSPCFSVCPTKVRARGDDDGCHRVAKEEGMA